MKILSQDYKKGFVKLKVEHIDDLWYLTYVVEQGDLLSAKTWRKIKIGGEDQRNTKVVKKPMRLKIAVEKVEFAKYSNVLRVSGIIKEGPEDIPLGSHHTIALEEGLEFKLQKEQFLKYQIEKIKEASVPSQEKILLCVHDREEAYFALLKKYGFSVLSTVKGNVTKKADVNIKTSDFFSEIKSIIVQYDQKQGFSHIIIASPGFWREYVQKVIPEDLKKKIVYATCSSVGNNGIHEVINRPEVQSVLKQEKFAKEIALVEKLLEGIATKGKVQYGFKEVAEATKAGAVEDVLVTDTIIHTLRQNDSFAKLEEIMKTVENMQGHVHIISSEHEGGKKLDGLGGVGAFLRYKLEY